MKVLSTFLILTLFSSCSYHYEETNSTGYSEGELVHTVILSLKDEVTQNRKEKIIEILKSLSDIKVTKGLTVSEKAETEDNRAKTNYNLVLQMSFNDLKDLHLYSVHSSHLDVRSQLKPDLASVPVIYDYWVK